MRYWPAFLTTIYSDGVMPAWMQVRGDSRSGSFACMDGRGEKELPLCDSRFRGNEKNIGFWLDPETRGCGVKGLWVANKKNFGRGERI